MLDVICANLKQIQLHVSEFLSQQFAADVFVYLEQEGKCFSVDCFVSDLEDNFLQGLDANKFAIINLDLVVVTCDNLSILLINMDEEIFEAFVDRISEDPEIQFEKCIEKEKLKAVIRKEIILFVKNSVGMFSVLLLFGG